MARRGVKKRDYENLDDSSIGRVVSLLEQESPITKKAACEILNISYNTSRLANIIAEYKKKIEHRKKRIKANRGTPYSNLELKELIIAYLSGSSITSIAESLFRGLGSVKSKIRELHLPERDKNNTYFKPALMPEEMVSENFSVGELVWSARYNCVAEIRAGSEWYQGQVYSIWVFGKYNQFAYQPWYELGKLKVLEELGLQGGEFITTEKPNFNYRID